MVQNIAEPYGLGYISEQQQPYPYFREYGCYCLVLCFPFKTTHIKR